MNQKNMMDPKKRKKEKKQLYDRYKENAHKRGLEFNLSFPYFLRLISKSCFYCYNPPCSCMFGILYTGIDRVDNNVGYHPYNVIPCCKFCNSKKSNKDYKEFSNKKVHRRIKSILRQEVAILMRKGDLGKEYKVNRKKRDKITKQWSLEELSEVLSK